MLLLLLVTTPTRLPAAGIEALEKRIARQPPISTQFVEYRFSRVLKRPLTSSGTLEYRADGVMARLSETPYRERTEVHGDEVVVAREGRPERRISLQRAPQLRLLLDTFRALLEGRLEPLRADFDLGIVEHGAHWTLTLKPRAPQIARHLARIEVHGAGERPLCMQALEPDGDAALTFFDPPLPRTGGSSGGSDRRGLEAACRQEPLRPGTARR